MTRTVPAIRAKPTQMKAGIPIAYISANRISNNRIPIARYQMYCALKRRLSTRRLTILLWQVSKYSPPNRTYTSQRIRLSTNILSLSYHDVSSCDMTGILPLSFSVVHASGFPKVAYVQRPLVSLHGAFPDYPSLRIVHIAVLSAYQ